MTNQESPAERSALPSKGARWLAFGAILVGGLCGGVIGFAFIDLQCDGNCKLWNGLGALIGALVSAVGLAVVANLTLRSMEEWRLFNNRRR
ncbi:MAG: hypothetical protein F4138_01370 [Acidimicrobiia bacterium]|nr:hypothetical protein [Acidimicrobiia bacterium]MYC58219.1 hypothetical protein [Acidimicrobiia bacterium]MYG93637.1 hypothetical protein [Acidimicrobiia bacterium]MYI30310.1 hypothetical protein [Acidimicrobiia bacterium]